MSVRLGLVGTGYWASTIHAPSAAQHPHVELAGVWGRDTSKAAELARQFGARAYREFDALLEDVDAVNFAIAPHAQAQLAIRAAECGKHLLLEKPISSSARSALELEQAVASTGVASIVFFTRRFMPDVADWLNRMMELGGWECGRAEFASRIFVPDSPYAQSEWRRDKGALWDTGPHALSLLCPLLGYVTNVIAGQGSRDQVHLVLRHVSGGSSTVSLSLTAPAAATGSLMYVSGEHGRESAPLPRFERTEVIAAHQRALDALLEQVKRAEAGHPCDVHFGAHVVGVLAAAEQSLLTGCQVPMV